MAGAINMKRRRENLNQFNSLNPYMDSVNSGHNTKDKGQKVINLVKEKYEDHSLDTSKEARIRIDASEHIN